MTDDTKRPIPPELKAAADRMKARARELLSKIDPEMREEILGGTLGSFEEVPEDYTEPNPQSIPLTPDGLSKLAERPNLLTDGFLAAFGPDAFERGRARGRLTRWAFGSEYFQRLGKKKSDTDG